MSQHKIVPVILSGGSGTRLWPLSREHHPKQLLALTGERTMLQETACRLDGLSNVQSPVVVCNEEYRFLVAEQLRQVGKKPCEIILEPVGRNTAPALALALAAGALLERRDVILSENESSYMPLGTRHRLENPGKIPLEMIEVQSGSYLGEDDIVRFADSFGRQ